MTSIYRPTEAIRLLKPSLRLPYVRPRQTVSKAAVFSTSHPSHATHSSTSNTPNSQPRKHITVASDDGRIRWADLSTSEKATRTTQQSFNLAIVAVGIALTGAVTYLLYTEVFSSDSKTSHFNRATDTIRLSPACTKLLGPGPQIKSYGEPSWSRWARNRIVASSIETDRWGTEHLHMKFYVEGPLNQGVVHVHMTKKPSQDEFVYRTLAVDVKGHQRIYLENAEEGAEKKSAPKIFGARWW
ncbi:import inner membrane translocase subunit tim-21, mitochondrial [Lindgomyces ingoldianus]|uniref:Import inner membrane translocase subunit tim-21, mitochondrial n=1 Tax=Lindgomyces ingoldianus TaxID=673940 RepID=A0ACB6R912_9PLEO|nr:import inner membrane translocase subunit tim-21, mitochondrial [Lindgomyces ingoldianus]KAF2475666.1 import inner membrane translocase subunit tim-21, mitochondrial [Lindgomyces ingoldianus]